MQTGCEGFQVAVIGASLSGATAARLLGEAGCSVALIEPEIFPRRKCCGEGLSELGLACLRDLGLWTEELQESAYPFYGYDICFLDGQHLDLTASDSRPQGYGISRTLLDTTVFRAAIDKPSVRWFHNRVQTLLKIPEGWSIVLNSGKSIQAEILIAACGAGVQKLFPDARVQNSKITRHGVSFWCRGTWAEKDPTRVYIHHRPEGQYIITPLGLHCINFSVLLNRSSVIPNKTEIIETACNIANEKGFIISDVTDTRGAPEIHSASIDETAATAYLLGDAVERFDPIGGMGMAHALYSAVLAAQGVIATIQSGDGKKYLLEYRRNRKRIARTFRILTSLSFSLNVYQHRWLKKGLTFCPGLAIHGMSLVKSAFFRTSFYSSRFLPSFSKHDSQLTSPQQASDIDVFLLENRE